MAKVLLVSYIRELLEERERIFSAAGHHAAAAVDCETAFQAIEQDAYDIAVLGFSVPEQERNDMASRLIRSNPNTQIIMIYFSSVQNTELADVLIPTTASASEILRAVNHVLNAQKSKTG